MKAALVEDYVVEGVFDGVECSLGRRVGSCVGRLLQRCWMTTESKLGEAITLV